MQKKSVNSVFMVRESAVKLGDKPFKPLNGLNPREIFWTAPYPRYTKMYMNKIIFLTRALRLGQASGPTFPLHLLLSKNPSLGNYLQKNSDLESPSFLAQTIGENGARPITSIILKCIAYTHFTDL